MWTQIFRASEVEQSMVEPISQNCYSNPDPPVRGNGVNKNISETSNPPKQTERSGARTCTVFLHLQSPAEGAWMRCSWNYSEWWGYPWRWTLQQPDGSRKSKTSCRLGQENSHHLEVIHFLNFCKQSPRSTKTIRNLRERVSKLMDKIYERAFIAEHTFGEQYWVVGLVLWLSASALLMKTEVLNSIPGEQTSTKKWGKQIS